MHSKVGPNHPMITRQVANMQTYWGGLLFHNFPVTVTGLQPLFVRVVCLETNVLFKAELPRGDM